jgi:hypothetical protein
MANPLQIVSKSSYVEEKSKVIFQSLVAQYQKGEIKSETELAYRAYRALVEFYAQIGKPSLVLRESGGLPVSADHNAMMKEIENDIRVLFGEMRLMSGAIAESFRYVETDRQGLQEQVRGIAEQYQALTQAVKQSASELSFRESFMDRSNFDLEMVVGAVAEINQQANVLTLGMSESDEVRDGATITILPESSGLPGNTHQVKPGDGFYRFHGEDHMHLDLQAILDGNADTWLEFEAIGMPQRAISITGGLGFQYHEGASWLKVEGAPLILSVKIELDRPRALNWVTMVPFIPEAKGAGAARLIKLLIEDGKGQSIDLADGSALGTERVILFPKMKVKRIIFTLSQVTGYDILAGHVFFKELEEAHTSIFEMGKMRPGKRIDGTKPSVENLGLSYDPVTQQTQMPSVRMEDPVLDRTEQAQRLFGLPEVGPRVQTALEAFPAKRYAIGLRDIGLASYRFQPTSAYVSRSYQSRSAIHSISLDAEDNVPAEFPAGSWLIYEISIDEGKQWHEISLSGSVAVGAKTEYRVGTRTPAEGRLAHVGYLEPVAPIYTCRVRITLSRPAVSELADSDYFTPVVHEYSLNIQTEGAV